MVLGIASTAMPFARTCDAQAERWLRLLRQHGEAGTVLQALGVSDAQRDRPAEQEAVARDPDVPGASRGHDELTVPANVDVVAEVGEYAAQIAVRRSATCVSTIDVLIAVMRVYGDAFDRVLRAHGTDSDTVLVMLDAQVRELGVHIRGEAIGSVGEPAAT